MNWTIHKLMALACMLSLLLSGCVSAPKVFEGHVVQVSSETHYLVVLDDHTLWGWGANHDKELTNTNDNQIYYPVELMQDVIQTAAGGKCSYALTTNGDLYGWGGNGDGCLGTGDSIQVITEPTLIMQDVKEVVASAYSTFAITNNGDLYGWGSNVSGALGNGTEDFVATPQRILDDVISVACSDFNTFAIRSDNSLWGWGTFSGENPDGTVSSYPPILMPEEIMKDVYQVAPGLHHIIVLKTDDTAWWIGAENATIPQKMLEEPLLLAEGVKSVHNEAGGYTWILMQNNTLCGWEQAGWPNTRLETNLEYPPTVILEDVHEVFPGALLTMAVKTDGSLWAWGRNYYAGWKENEEYWEEPTMIMAPKAEG